MAKKQFWIGTTGPFFYDDADLVSDPDGVLPPGTTAKPMIAEDQLNVLAAPSLSDHVLRKSDIPGYAGAIVGDGISGRTLRQIGIFLEDGTVAATAKCSTINEWNSKANGPTDNCAKGATTGVFTLNAGGTDVRVEAAGLLGNCVMAHGVLAFDGSAFSPVVGVIAGTNAILLAFFSSLGVPLDVTTMVNTGSLYVLVLYLTDA
jgi:hypothetical protein